MGAIAALISFSSLIFDLCLQDYKEEWDPCKFHSEKSGRGPLPPSQNTAGKHGTWSVSTLGLLLTHYTFGID